MNNQFGNGQQFMPQQQPTNYQNGAMYGYPNQPIYRTQLPFQQMNYSVLPGRIVNNLEEIRPNEVPNDGSIAVFPLSDGSAVFLKYFTGEGRINTVKFIVESPDTPAGGTDGQNDIFAAMNQRFDKLERMLAKQRYNKKPYPKKEEAVTNVESDD